MLVANSSFDLWQKDAFFSAAEEVQQSADIMESMYRLWLRGTKEQQSRELQIALGTAKWQLDEFVKAVRFGCHRQDNIANRHKQFIDAMEDQISRVEKALIDSLAQEEHTFRWVRLDDEETTDLHRFLLSGTPTSQITDANREIDVSDTNYITVEQEAKCSAKIAAELELSDQRGSWKMVIVDEGDDKPRNTQEQSIELASKSSFWWQNPFLPKRKRIKFTKMFRRVSNVVRQVHVTTNSQITRSFQILLFLMLFIFFLGMLFRLVA